MDVGRDSLVAGCVLAIAVLAFPLNTRAGNQEHDKPSTVARGERWRVEVPDPVANRVTRDALDGAWGLFAGARCRSVLTEFADSERRPLADRLDALGVDVQRYFTLIVFVDGTRNRACVTGVVAFTTPGSRVVRLCPDELKRTWQQNPTHVVAAFIHEMLHTLGLGENPPSSQEITRRVLGLCHDE